MTMTRLAIIRFTVAVPLALAVLVSVPAQRSAAGTTIAKAGMTSSLGAAASVHRMSNGKIAFSVSNDGAYRNVGGYRLDVINPDGTGQKHLTALCPADCRIEGIAWSPHGTRLAFLQGESNPWLHTTMSLFVVNADGSGEKRLARCELLEGCDWIYRSRLSWSPDGSKIVFSDRQSVYVVKVNGGGLRRLTHCSVTLTHSASGAITGRDKNSCQDIGPAWSPDGSRIAFERLGNTDSGVYVVNADGSGLKALTQGGGPVWSPDGRSIAFIGSNGIYAVNPDGSHLKFLVSRPPVGGPSIPSWSPDRTRILYFSTPKGPQNRIEMWVMNANGTGRRRLSYSACCINSQRFPTWSPDGKHIAFDVFDRSHPGGIYLIDADGRHLHRLTQVPTLIAWQPIP
jgi:Tol biopolymer transport system component